ncbi:hypothetical protein PFICI_13272 [Pestalotiopsis fici W106-1]|uniref:Uncharacterized protein n=1 Tax=Pestalotiopsis fici (strain W106-1 / CGMCC3.15140) TaxID=1229662 RepID=W3WLQ7_PESFW|nr:uncharacterized protein PFICI_13272 [Pestalotiopsis fici W106-1]ETS74788.1 hypothetical protein PFICI_13272 [Pestalotiopsis fici W106-1]
MSSLAKPSGAATTPLRSLPQMSSMRREFVLSPITALAFYTSTTDGRLYLLAGEDNHVKVYDVETSEFRGDVGLFAAQSVHGIAVSKAGGGSGDEKKQQRILVWGGFSVAILPIDLVEAVISDQAGQELTRPVVVVEEASDWVFEGIISPYAPDELALLTAHNDLIKARYDEDSGRIVFLETVSPSRPILYSGNLSWEEPDCILVAAGTVFGEIVVWKYSTISSKSQESPCEILFIFSGHEGSIFGVHVSPIIHLETGESLRLLASCSDDRTIRIWDITDPQDLSTGTREEYQRKILAVRQTGFGDSIEESSTDESAARCLAVAMGHISRIWQVEFPLRQPRLSSSSIDLWSFGEDATAQKWSLSLGTSHPSTNGGDKAQVPDLPTRTRGQLKNEAIYANHNGKNIWSHAIRTDDSGQLLVVTGASDGKLSVIGSCHRVTEGKTLEEMPAMPEVVELDEESTVPQEEATATPTENSISPMHPDSYPSGEDASKNPTPKTSKPTKKKKKVKKPTKDFFNRYALLSDNTILTSTKNGRFFIANATKNSSWEQLYLPDHLRDASSTYAVIKGSFDASTAYVGTAEGNVFVYRSGGSSKLEHVASVHGKVSDIFSLTSSPNVSPSVQVREENATQGKPVEHHRSKVLVTVLGSDSASLLGFDETSESESPKQVHIPVDRRFIVTSAATHKNLVVLGSRTGYISVLESADDKVYEVKASVEPKTNDCVTSITFLPPKANEGSVNFLTTSRDGKFRIYTLYKNQESWHVTLIHETSPPFGPIIEGASLAPSDDEGGLDLILYGFRSTKFIVWNETQRREIASIECGGGHRTFVYDAVQSALGDFRLVWTQASQLCFFSQSHASHRALKSGGHGREIKAVAASGDLVATAAEDTTIRIWSYANQGQAQNAETSMRCLAVLENHTAGIQSMKWHKQSHLFSSGGNKEFFVWRLSQLSSAYRGLAVKCEAVYPDRSDDIDLRIMNFDVSCVDDTTTSLHGPSFLITMALSNSTLLTYAYSETAGFQLVAKGSYTGACMTQVQHLHVDDAAIQVLTTATDGYVAVWEAAAPLVDASSSSHDVVAEFRTSLVTRLHQSTMKSLDIKTFPSGADDDGGTSYLVATGGDDNGIGAMHLYRNGASGRFAVRSKSMVRSAHAAAVTGIGFLSLGAEGTVAVLASCSNDQRVKRWEIADALGERPRFRLLDNRYSAIADAGDLEVLDEAESFVVGGVGLEIWAT